MFNISDLERESERESELSARLYHVIISATADHNFTVAV